MVLAAITIFVWKFAVRPLGGAYDIYELLPAFLVNLVATYIVSYITPAPSKEVEATFDEVMKNI